MNHSKKTVKFQQAKVVKDLNNGGVDSFHNLLTQNSIKKIIAEDLPNYRDRLYNPLKTLSMFLTQALDEDSSCQNIVDKEALKMDKKISIITGGYCRARQRLHVKMIKNLTKQTSEDSLAKVPKKWKFEGRDIYLVDGTTFTMPDTKENQKTYPQQASLPQGLSFPICRAVGIISLYTGTIIDAAVSPYQGKGASEQVLLRSMLSNFKKGDIILADAFYSTYYFLNYVIQNDIDVVLVQHGMRAKKTDFTKGEILGKKDHLISIKKPPKKPDWMSEQKFDKLPKTLTIRELKRGGKILITTMLCKNRVPATQIKNLYKQRWQIEVDFRNIKSTLGLKHFSCKTPQMAIKEMWVYFLAYNFIRSIMLESAIYNRLLPRQLSFKHTVQILKNAPNQYDNRLYKKILSLIGQKVIGNREGRIEPRAIKRRHNDFPLLMKHRDIAREEIKQNGHPKKLK
jgi:hypothetical protein